MSTQGKVIITCAITGSIHTPSMTPHLADHAGPDRRRGNRRFRGRCGDPASPRPRPRVWKA
jgi:hypothetical protein